MKTVNNNSQIHAFGVSFKNISEAIAYALEGKPKEGVYVGEDSQRYPCFDSEDYATENRYYWNLVFATSQEELDEKLKKLKEMEVLGMNYYKLTDGLAPMAYWEGDSNNKVILTDNMGEKGGLSTIIKKVFLAIVLAFIGQTAFALNADTLDADSTFSPKQHITQVPLENCYRIDTCENKRFAIVLKDAKCGIYDLTRHENVTNIEYDDLSFSRLYIADDKTEIFYFYAEKGIEQGVIGVYGNNNQMLGIWHDNPEYVGNLEECTTIDKAISEKCQSLLKKGMSALDGTYGQVAVIDANNGRLKAWVALEEKEGKFKNAKLLKKVFSPRSIITVGTAAVLADLDANLEDSVDAGGGVYDTEDGLKIKDDNWRTGGYGKMTMREALVKKSNVAMYKMIQMGMGNERAHDVWQQMMEHPDATNAMEIAASTWSIHHEDASVYPTLKGDSVEVAPHNTTTSRERQYIKDVLVGLNRVGGIQAEYAPQGVEIAGVYGNWGKDYYTEANTLTETSFVGFFPAQAPRYSICVFIHRPDEPTHSSRDLATSMVNELVAWLINH